MPNSVFVSSKHCSIAQRTPLSHTKRRNGALMGALLREYQYRGWAPSVRLMSNHTAVVGCPALHSLIRLRANSYVMGPLVPSDTVRRYQNVVGSAWANAATVLGGVLVTATRLVRGSPLEREVCVVVASGWSQHRGSAGVATNATVPTQASQAVQKSGLLP